MVGLQNDLLVHIGIQKCEIGLVIKIQDPSEFKSFLLALSSLKFSEFSFTFAATRYTFLWNSCNSRIWISGDSHRVVRTYT